MELDPEEEPEEEEELKVPVPPEGWCGSIDIIEPDDEDPKVRLVIDDDDPWPDPDDPEAEDDDDWEEADDRPASRRFYWICGSGCPPAWQSMMVVWPTIDSLRSDGSLIKNGGTLFRQKVSKEGVKMRNLI